MMGGFGLPLSHLGDGMELQERINMTIKGQLTWANPDLGKKCIQCAHISPAHKPVERKRHVCSLVRLHTGKKGVPYDAIYATACNKFHDIDNSDAEA